MSNNYRIKRVLNNNAVIATSGRNDLLLLGLSIGYHKSANDLIPSTAVEHKYMLSDTTMYQKLEELFQQIPQDILDFSMELVSYIKSSMNIELSDNLYITIPDHIYTSIQRYREGIKINHMMLWEIKSFFCKEFEIGIYVLDCIKECYHIEMEEDEAAFIALHIINAAYDTPTPIAMEITRFIRMVVKEVEECLNITLNTESLSYFRFITHLKYLGKKIISHEQECNLENEDSSDELLRMLQGKYVVAYDCMLHICNLIKQQFNYQTTPSDQLYLTIHFQKLLIYVLSDK